MAQIYKFKSDVYRESTRGQYDTDFRCIDFNSIFPSREVIDRHKVYAYRERQYNGLYNKNKQLSVKVAGKNKTIPYPVIQVNRFALISNKFIDYIFNGEQSIRTGDAERDKICNEMANKYSIFNSLRRGFLYGSIYGDCPLRISSVGISAMKPYNCIKIVNEHDINDVLGHVVFEYLRNKKESVSNYIRFEIHYKGWVYEVVKRYYGVESRTSTIGKSVEYNYRGRVIPEGGIHYPTNIDDCETVQWITFNGAGDGVYGQSLYQDIESLIYAIEIRLSSEFSVLSTMLDPVLIVGMNMVQPDKKTGGYTLKITDSNFLVSSNGDGDIKSFQQQYNMENSEKLIDRLENEFYELSEMTRAVATGEFSGGNISEETMNNKIKSTLDKAKRIYSENENTIIKAIYVFLRLNGVDIKLEDIKVQFNIGRIDDMKAIADFCKTFIEIGMLSKFTCRKDFLGYSDAQALEEQKLIDNEKAQNSEVNNNIVDITDTDNVNKQNKGLEDKNNGNEETKVA